MIAIHAWLRVKRDRDKSYAYCIFLFNPRRMREGYGSHFVSVSAPSLAAIYLVYESRVQCYKVP